MVEGRSAREGGSKGCLAEEEAAEEEELQDMEDRDHTPKQVLWLMASQATRITAYDIWGAKIWRKKYEKYFVQFACDRWEIFLVPERKYFCHPKIFYV
jgi:hypothetical protein